MAHAVRERLGVTIGLGITGIAGPDPLEGKPVGTIYIAVEGPEGSSTTDTAGRRAAARNDNKRLSVYAALNLLRRFLER